MNDWLIWIVVLLVAANAATLFAALRISRRKRAAGETTPRRAPADAPAVKALEELGASVSFDEHGRADCVQLQNTGITDEQLAPLAELRHLRVLNLRNCAHVTDAGLVHLKKLTSSRSSASVGTTSPTKG
jgi:hypothetical protein